MVTKKVRCIYGYEERIKSVSYDRALKYKPYAQAGVLIDGPDNDEFILVSYETWILHVSRYSLEFYGAPDYSRSTINHVIAFLKEYAPSIKYMQVKEAYHTSSTTKWEIIDNRLVNPETGEVI